MGPPRQLDYTLTLPEHVLYAREKHFLDQDLPTKVGRAGHFWGEKIVFLGERIA